MPTTAELLAALSTNTISQLAIVARQGWHRCLLSGKPDLLGKNDDMYYAADWLRSAKLYEAELEKRLGLSSTDDSDGEVCPIGICVYANFNGKITCGLKCIFHPIPPD